MNELNLYFGPKLPTEFETVGLSFVAAPTLRADSAIGVLSAIRYAKQNYDHLETEQTVFDAGAADARLDVSFGSQVIKAFSNTSSSGLQNVNGEVLLTSETWGPQVLNSAIKVAGMQISLADTWSPIIQPGVVWRGNYVLAASGIEPSGSWIRRAIPEDGRDHNLILIYSIAEALYSIPATGNYGLDFPKQPAKFKTIKEIANVVAPHRIAYSGNLTVLQTVKVNGTTRFSGTFTNSETDTFLKSLDTTVKFIETKSSLAPDDLIELEYLSYDDFYVYTGFRDVSGSWWPFDANPEYGHIIGNQQDNMYDLSSDALLRQVTLYAIPSAVIEYKFIPYPTGGSKIGRVQLDAYRAIDYGETHYVRHVISSEPVEQINSRDGGTVLNTWGYAVFGRNFYDEQNHYGGDIFNTAIPSMIPLGRFVLGAPASVQSVTLADIRQRGGGVPMDFPMIAVESQEDGLDKLRGFLDMGIWEGKAIKEGGVVEIQISQTLLKTDPDDTNPNTFLASEIYEIVRNQVPPGIDFTISYVGTI